jgi:hypothetical protein
MRLFAALVLLIALSASGMRNLPDVTRESMIGTWEAVVPTEEVGMNGGLYRIEIFADGSSYIIGMIFTRNGSRIQFAARLTSAEVDRGNVKLRFQSVRGEDGRESEEIVFTGSGVAEDGGGALHGALSRGSAPIAGGELWFHKGSWTRGFGEASRKAEREVRKLRGKSKT